MRAAIEGRAVGGQVLALLLQLGRGRFSLFLALRELGLSGGNVLLPLPELL